MLHHRHKNPVRRKPRELAAGELEWRASVRHRQYSYRSIKSKAEVKRRNKGFKYHLNREDIKNNEKRYKNTFHKKFWPVNSWQWHTEQEQNREALRALQSITGDIVLVDRTSIASDIKHGRRIDNVKSTLATIDNIEKIPEKPKLHIIDKIAKKLQKLLNKNT